MSADLLTRENLLRALNAQLYLDDIREACERIMRYSQGLDLNQFVQDEKTFDAVVRNLEVIGEAAKHIPPDKSVLSRLGVTQLGPNWVIPTAIYGVFWPITRHMWGSLPANCVSPTDVKWNKLAGLRDIVAHKYFGLDEDIRISPDTEASLP